MSLCDWNPIALRDRLSGYQRIIDALHSRLHKANGEIARLNQEKWERDNAALAPIVKAYSLTMDESWDPAVASTKIELKLIPIYARYYMTDVVKVTGGKAARNRILRMMGQELGHHFVTEMIRKGLIEEEPTPES